VDTLISIEVEFKQRELAGQHRQQPTVLDPEKQEEQATEEEQKN